MLLDAQNKVNYDDILKLLIMESENYPYGEDDNHFDRHRVIDSLADCSIKQIHHSREKNYEDWAGIAEYIWLYTITILPKTLNAFQDLESYSERFIEKVMYVVYRRYTSNDEENYDINVKIELPQNWRDQLKEKATNQNPYGGRHTYENMNFNSPPEIAIATELDKRGIMYLPNCVARVGDPEARKRVIPDFLIFYNNKWGILEVSGKTYHTDTNKDSARERELEKHGNLYSTHYPAMECQNNPEKIVDDFLIWLSKR